VKWHRPMRCLPVLLLVATACGTSSPARFYTLESPATANGAPALQTSVVVGPVTIPGAVDRPQFVAQIAPNRVDIDDFNRWASPLAESIARVVAGNLAVLLGTSEVAVAPFASFAPAWRVGIDVQRFESVPGSYALIDSIWTLRDAGGSAIRTGHSLARVAVRGAGYEELAAAHSRALASLSDDVAAAIRTSSAQKP